LLRTELSRAGDPKKTAAMQAYMKSAMPYWGVQTPVQRDITRRLFTANRLETAEEWREACLTIWRAAEYREERYAAIDLRRFRFPTNPPTLILGGAQDPIIPPEAATDFMLKAKAAGLDVRQILFPYSGHDFNTTYDSITNQALLQIISQFAIDHGAGPAGLRTNIFTLPLETMKRLSPLSPSVIATSPAS